MVREMTITISLSPEVEKKLRQRAVQNGQDVEGYVHQLIEKSVVADEIPVHAGLTFDEILAPIREEFEASGMSEEEALQLFDEELKAVRQERRRRKERVGE